MASPNGAPLTKDFLIALLQSGMPSQRLSKWIAARKVSVVLDPNTATELRSEGASDQLLVLIVKNNVYPESMTNLAISPPVQIDDRVSQIIRGLRSQDVRVRVNAAVELGRIRSSDAVGLLIATLKDTNSYVRDRAAESLGNIGAPAVEPLIATLKESDADVRAAAALTLGDIKDPRAVEPLIVVLGDADARVRGRAARSLGKIGAPASEPLIAALKDTNWRVRDAAVEALRDIQTIVPSSHLSRPSGIQTQMSEQVRQWRWADSTILVESYLWSQR